jgi:hypothetical protein
MGGAGCLVCLAPGFSAGVRGQMNHARASPRRTRASSGGRVMADLSGRCIPPAFLGLG